MVAQIDQLDPVELQSEAAWYVQRGTIAIDQGGARLGEFLAGWLVERMEPGSRDFHAAMCLLCDRLNREVLPGGAVFIPLWPEQLAALRTGLACGDWTIDPQRRPEWIVSRILRRPDGTPWTTEGGGALTPIGWGLASWAAQRDDTPTCSTVLEWIDDLAL